MIPTEEERKAAAAIVATFGPHELNVEEYVYPDGSTCIEIHSDAVRLQIQLTRTQKRLKGAKGLLHDSLPLVQCVDGCECSADLLFKKIIAFLNPPAEGE